MLTSFLAKAKNFRNFFTFVSFSYLCICYINLERFRMFLTWVLLIVGFVLITVGATWLTNGSAAIAQRLRISEYVIGMTIVAVGTSLPELTVSIASTFAGSADMAIGNIVGSNIFNILFVLGLCALFAPVVFTKSNIKVDIPICITVSVALLVMLLNGNLSHFEGAALLLCYIAIIIFSIRSGKQSDEEIEPQKNFSWFKSVGMVAVGFLGLIYGADLTLNSAVDIARDLGVSERVIAITLLAGGTSLPELAASLVAIMRGHGAMALGNVVGSNIANILLILGSCATISPLFMKGITMIDLMAMVAAVLLLLVSALVFGNRRIVRGEGIVFLAAYAVYIWYLIG